MTIDDFMRVLIPQQASGEAPRKVKEIPAAFKIADQNNDGLISFEEYLFFVTLLSIPETSFKVKISLLIFISFYGYYCIRWRFVCWL